MSEKITEADERYDPQIKAIYDGYNAVYLQALKNSGKNENFLGLSQGQANAPLAPSYTVPPPAVSQGNIYNKKQRNIYNKKQQDIINRIRGIKK